MKYGVLLNKNNLNLGDDIQAYGTARFYPSLDYFIDREHINNFQSENNEPVAVIMNAWYMWEKWHWPPARCIVPHFVGFHYADHKLAVQPGSPLSYEALEGLGGEYLKAYGPIGCRDYFTRDRLQELGIDSYFSGCITLTLPKMPERKPEKEYICIVDADKRVRKKLKELLKDSGYELKFMTHNGSRDSDRSWEARKQVVEELLTTYRNAHLVITKRLHCALPSLSQGTPVLLIKGMDDDIRFSPYYDLLHYINTTDFLNDNYTFDFANPPENKPEYQAIAEQLTKSCQDFVARVSGETRSVAELDRFNASDDEVFRWRYGLMDRTLALWYEERREEFKQAKADRAEYARLEAEKNKLAEQLQSEKEKLKAETAKLKAEQQKLKAEKEKHKKETDALKQKLDAANSELHILRNTFAERVKRKLRKIYYGIRNRLKKIYHRIFK